MSAFRMISTYPSDVQTNKQLYFLKQLFQIFKLLITDEDIKILHIHTASRGSFFRKSIVALLGNVLGKKTIMHVHGGLFHAFYQSSVFMRLWVKSVFRSCDRVICLTSEWSRTFSDELKLTNLAIVLNPVKSFLPRPTNYNGSISLLFMGTITANKGIFELVDYLLTNPHYLSGKIRLVICGEGESEKLLSLIKKDTWVNNIQFVGWVDGSNKDEFIYNSDIFILPSHYEGLPMAILESMSAGKPIISTKVGGIPTVVKPSSNGWLIEPKKINQLDVVFDQIFTSPEVITRFSQQAYEDAKKFHVGAIVSQLHSIYEQLLVSN